LLSPHIEEQISLFDKANRKQRLKLQELLYRAAPRYVKALKRERAKASKKGED
jgi:hypothetical protein